MVIAYKAPINIKTYSLFAIVFKLRFFSDFPVNEEAIIARFVSNIELNL